MNAPLIEAPTPDWFALLQYQRVVRGLTGLTLPFLIGAALEADLSGTEQERNNVLFGKLNDLLVSFHDATPSPYRIFIAECEKLHQPIAALYKPNEGKPDCEGLSYPRSRASPRLYVQRSYFQRANGRIESAIEGLWALSEVPLMRGDFSFLEDHYAPFDAGDREFIDDARRWWSTQGREAQGRSDGPGKS